MSSKVKRPMSPSRYLFIGFFTTILLGSLLLSLPVSHNSGVPFPYIDALFTSVSAVCVTGLSTVDIAQTLTIFGRVVLAILIMIGGIGVAGMIISIALFLGLRVGISQSSIISESYNLGSLKGTLKVLKVVVFTSLTFQILGAALFFPLFLQTFSPIQSLGHSLFHSISSFNNAGFDLMGNFVSLNPYRENIGFQLITMTLIVIGGLGFFVIADMLHTRFKWKGTTMHTKMVLSATFLLIVVGALSFYLFSDKSVIDSLFLSITSRTAGFSTFDITLLYQVELWVLILLMFIGASPGSTGGGVKTTTMFTVLLSLFPLQKKKDVAIFSRRISNESVLKAYQVCMLGIFTVITTTFVMLVCEQGKYETISLFFESVSAFATVGLSTGITTTLTSVSKIALMIAMFIGRVGPITIASSFTKK
ncbi:MAG: ATPase, partial [Spirochaetia bacterium]|nr:ATPase [Spirochaetia bacterium]